MGLFEKVLIGATKGALLNAAAVGTSFLREELSKKERIKLAETLSKTDVPITEYLSGNAPIIIKDRDYETELRYLDDREMAFQRKLSSVKNYEDLMLFIKKYSDSDKEFLLRNCQNAEKITKNPRSVSFAFVDDYITNYIKLVKETDIFESAANKEELIQKLENDNLDLIKKEIVETIKQTNTEKKITDIPGANKEGLDGILWAVNTDYKQLEDGTFNFVNISSTRTSGFFDFTSSNLAVKKLFRIKVNNIARENKKSRKSL